MRRDYRVLVLSSVVCVLFFLLASFWFSPAGTGEYQNSPDGRFIAHTFNMSEGNWFKGRVQFIKLSVVESASDREIWQVQYRPKAGVKVPDYGNRADHFIVWAQDSASVTILTSSDRKVTLSLPIP